MADNGIGPEDTSDEAPEDRKGFTRRDLIKRAAIVGGAAVWAAPVIRLVAGSGAGPTAQSLDGVQLAVFEAPCANVGLGEGGPYTATVCAKNESGAVTAFNAHAKTACTSKCGQLGPCVTGTCKPPSGKSGGPIIGTVICVGPGADCDPAAYARRTKQWVCTALVTCKCVCR